MQIFIVRHPRSDSVGRGTIRSLRYPPCLLGLGFFSSLVVILFKCSKARIFASDSVEDGSVIIIANMGRPAYTGAAWPGNGGRSEEGGENGEAKLVESVWFHSGDTVTGRLFLCTFFFLRYFHVEQPRTEKPKAYFYVVGHFNN